MRNASRQNPVDPTACDPDAGHGVHVHVTPAARILLNFLSASFGKILLFHLRRDGHSGDIAWSPGGSPDLVSNHVLWLRTEQFDLYIDAEDSQELHGRQLVIEAAFGGNPARRLFTESKLVSLIRPAGKRGASLAAPFRGPCLLH